MAFPLVVVSTLSARSLLRGFTMFWICCLGATAPAWALPTVAWTQTYHEKGNAHALPGCSKDERAHQSHALDAQGNVFVAGCAYVVGGDDMLIYKLDGITGQVLWSRTYSSEFTHDDNYALAVDASGNVAVTGRIGKQAASFARTVKYDGMTGQELWVAEAPGEGRVIAFDAQGDVVVVGTFSENVQPDPHLPPVPPVGRMRTFKYGGLDGALQWTADYAVPPGSSATGTAVAVNAEGAVYALAVVTASGALEYRLLKYSGDGGALQWTQSQQGKPGSSALGTLALDSEGNAFVAAEDNNSGVLAAKYGHADGALLWTKTLFGSWTGLDDARATVVDQSGDLYATGVTTSPYSGAQIWTAKLSGGTGAQKWYASLNSSAPGVASGYAIAVRAGKVAVTGTHNTGADGGFQVGRTILYNAATGAMIWTTRANGTHPANLSAYGSDRGAAVSFDGNGDVVATVLTWDAVTGRNVRTIKYAAANGTERWSTIEPDVPIRTGVSGTGFGGLVNLHGPSVMAVDGAGDVVITGHREGTSQPQQFVTAKFDGLTGQRLWSTKFDSSGSVYASTGMAVAADADGNVVATGGTDDGASQMNMRTIKYHGTTGAVLWNSTFVGAAFDRATQLAIDHDGHVVIAGTTYGGTATRYDIAVIKYHGVHGGELWNVRYTTARDDSVHGIAVDAAGDVFIVGVSDATDPVMRTVKLNGATGQEIWAVAFAGTPEWWKEEGASSVVLDPQGNAFVTGTSFEAGRYVMRTVKYDGVTGAQLWTAAFAGDGPALEGSVSQAIARDEAGDVYVTGWSSDADGGRNMRTVKYAGATGVQLWTASFSGEGGGEDAGVALSVDAAGNVVVTGFSLDGGGDRNIRLIKYDGATGSEIWNQSYAGSMGLDDTGYAVKHKAGALFLFGLTKEEGLPQGWFLRKFVD